MAPEPIIGGKRGRESDIVVGFIGKRHGLEG
jgi:hypothetical protein